MKNKKCLNEFIKYSFLNVFGMLGLSLYILADTFFIAKGLGPNGLTALNLAIPVYSIVHGMGLLIGIGGAIKYSIAKSRGRRGNAIFTNAIYLTIGIGIIFFIAGFFFADVVVKSMGADDSIFKMSKTYIQIILLFAPIFMLNNVLLCFVRNDDAPKLATIAMLTGSFSNIVLDYIFIFPLGMGIFGAVLATGLAPVISLSIISLFFIKKKNNFTLKKCRISRDLIWQIFLRGIPSLITELSAGIIIIVFNFIILKIKGNIGVAAYGVVANLSIVVLSIYIGIAQGCQPLMSSYYGANREKELKLTVRYAIAAVVTISIMVYMVIFCGAEYITLLFNSQGNLMLQTIAVKGLRIYFLAIPFAGFNIIITTYFASTSHTSLAHIISILRGFILMIPTAFILSRLADMTGVWLVFPLVEIMVGIMTVAMVKKAVALPCPSLPISGER
ncbi:MAG: MATE family efflux transporter [Clostridium sp.]|nr:MATE family efflux transporter [Clostridium sp.]